MKELKEAENYGICSLGYEWVSPKSTMKFHRVWVINSWEKNEIRSTSYL